MTAVADDIWAILCELPESQEETDRKFQETDRKLKEVMAGLGKRGNCLGDFIEDAVRPAAPFIDRSTPTTAGVGLSEGAACDAQGGPDRKAYQREEF